MTNHEAGRCLPAGWKIFPPSASPVSNNFYILKFKYYLIKTPKGALDDARRRNSRHSRNRNP